MEILIIGMAIVLTVGWFWTLIDCAVRLHPKEMDKLVWVLIIVSTWIFGAAAYLLLWRPRTTPAALA